MGMEIPDWTRTMFLITTGESWPEADEDKLRALSTVWNAFATQLADTETTIRTARQSVTTSWTGQGADAFTTRLDQLVDTGHIKALRDTSTALTAYTQQAALNVEYAKMMIIGQLVILFLTFVVPLLKALAFPPAAPAAAAAITAAQALGRHLAIQIIRQLASSLAWNLGLQVSLDVAIQAAQVARRDRTEWDTNRTAGAALTATIGSGVGALLSPLAHLVATRFNTAVTHQTLRHAGSLAGHMGQSALHEWTAEAAADLILNGRREAPAGWAATAGATEGAIDWTRDRTIAKLTSPTTG
ncbi:WXG100 family type VII secretion target, partial [Micromonospora echinofusca]